MDRPPRKRSGLVPVVVAFVCAAMLSLGAVPHSPKEDPAVATFAQELQQALDAARLRHVGRTPLAGETVDGDHDAAVARVAARLRAMGESGVPHWNRTARRVERDGVWAPERIAPFRAGARGVVEALREAATTRIERPAKPQYVPAALLRDLVEVETALLLAEGKGVDAVETWLAGATFLIDGDSVQWLQSLPFEDTDLAAMPHEARATLALGLQRADERLAAIVDPRAELANFALPLCDGSYRLWDWSAHEIAHAWRFGFDPAAHHLEGMRRQFATMSRAGAAAVTGEQREAEWTKVDLSAATWLTGYVHESTRDHERARRRVCARFRLLRLAVAFHAREELPVLVDPWNGEPFEVAIDGDAATLRAREEFEGREWVAVRR